MSDSSAVVRLSFALEAVAEVDPHLCLSHLAVLLTIARKPGCSPGDLIDELGISSASAARLVARVSDWETPVIKGLGLVRSEMDPYDRRKRNLFLTPEGQRLINRVVEALS